MSFNSYQINDRGEIVFLASLSGDDVINENDRGIWLGREEELELIVREGMIAPGTPPESIFEEINPPVLSDSGEIAFSATIVGPNLSNGQKSGIWLWSPEDFRLVVQSGDSIPGTSGNTIGRIPEFLGINQDGQILFSGFSVIYIASSDGLTSVASEETMVPSEEFPPGITFRSFFNPTLNDLGQVLFTASIEGPGIASVGIWTGIPGDLRLVALQGTQVPNMKDGLKFSSLVDTRDRRIVIENRPRLNDKGQVAFLARDTRRGIWIDDFGEKTNVAREGLQIPDSPRGTVFSSDFGDPVLNNLGQLGFRSSARIFFYDPDTERLITVVRSGSLIELTSGSVLGITTITPFGSPSPMSLNDAGQIIFEADFGSIGWGFFIANVKRRTDDESVGIDDQGSVNPEETTAGDADIQKFIFDLNQLDRINDGPLSEGSHTLKIQVVDEFRNISEFLEIDFELDTVAPMVPTLDLSQQSDSDPVGDMQTDLPTVTLVGKTDPSATVDLTLIGATIDNFESYPPRQIVIGSSVSSKPWRRFGPATNDNVTISSKSFDFIFGKAVISGIHSGQYGLEWSGVEDEFGAIRYQFDGPVDLSTRSLVSVKMFSDNPVGTKVSLAFGNGSTTYRTDKHVFLTTNMQELVFKITEPDLFLNDGTESYSDVISNVTEIGFTFTSRFAHTETIIMDDFIFPITGAFPSAPRTTVSDAEGSFFFEVIPLTPGPNDFTVLATDTAGNQSESTTRIIRLSPP